MIRQAVVVLWYIYGRPKLHLFSVGDKILCLCGKMKKNTVLRDSKTKWFYYCARLSSIWMYVMQGSTNTLKTPIKIKDWKFTWVQNWQVLFSYWWIKHADIPQVYTPVRDTKMIRVKRFYQWILLVSVSAIIIWIIWIFWIITFNVC